MTGVHATVEASLSLVRHDWFMRQRDFAALCKHIRALPISDRYASRRDIDGVCRALDLACALYWKQVLCLQRSAVLVEMLRRRGVPAHMVIGAQKLPFKAHAWVEVGGQILSDKRAAREDFLIMEVC